jgi:hypothetical protein
MADDASPIFSDEAILTQRARKAGIDIESISEVARVRLLREFRTDEEKRALAEQGAETMEEDARRYNAHVEKYGFWNAHIRPW